MGEKDRRPVYWDGADWVREESVTLPDDLQLSELLKFTDRNGVPLEARFSARIQYQEHGPEVVLTWYVPADEGDGS